MPCTIDPEAIGTRSVRAGGVVEVFARVGRYESSAGLCLRHAYEITSGSREVGDTLHPYSVL